MSTTSMKYFLLFCFLSFGWSSFAQQKDFAPLQMVDAAIQQYTFLDELSFTWRLSENNKPFDFEVPDTALLMSSVIDFRDTGKQRIVLIKTTQYYVEEDAPVISAIVLKKQKGKWQFLAVDYFYRGGNWGDIPPFEWVNYAPEELGIVLRPGGVNMGYTIEGMLFYRLVDNRMKLVLEIGETYEDNAGNCSGKDCYAYDTKYSVVTDKKVQSTRLELVKTGTAWNEMHEGVRIEEKRSFTYNAALQLFEEE